MVYYFFQMRLLAKVLSLCCCYLNTKEINSESFPLYFQAYIREGTALQQLGQHADALAAFAAGLANDTNNTQLLNGLTESVLKSPLQGKLLAKQ